MQIEREQLTLIHRNALRLYKLVNSLLDFSRIEAGRARAQFEAVDLASLTADLTSIFRSATERFAFAFHLVVCVCVCVCVLVCCVCVCVCVCNSRCDRVA